MSAKKPLKRNEVLSIQGIKENPLSIRILNKYTIDEKLDFDKMCKSLEEFLNTDKLEKKIRFIFELYDSDGDDFISSIELFDLLKDLNKGVIDDKKIQNIVDRTFAETGEYKTKMNYSDFRMLIFKSNSNLKSFLKCKK